MELDKAIAQLEAEVEALGFPDAGTVTWWLLRAQSTSLSMLKSIKANDLDMLQAESLRKTMRRTFMLPATVLEAKSEELAAQPAG